MPNIEVGKVIVTLQHLEDTAKVLRRTLESALDKDGRLKLDKDGRLKLDKGGRLKVEAAGAGNVAAGKACPLRASCATLYNKLQGPIKSTFR